MTFKKRKKLEAEGLRGREIVTLVSIQIEVEAKRFLPAVVFWVVSGGGGRLDVDGGNTVAFCITAEQRGSSGAAATTRSGFIPSPTLQNPILNSSSSISTDPARVKT